MLLRMVRFAHAGRQRTWDRFGGLTQPGIEALASLRCVRSLSKVDHGRRLARWCSAAPHAALPSVTPADPGCGRSATPTSAAICLRLSRPSSDSSATMRGSQSVPDPRHAGAAVCPAHANRAGLELARPVGSIAGIAAAGGTAHVLDCNVAVARPAYGVRRHDALHCQHMKETTDADCAPPTPADSCMCASGSRSHVRLSPLQTAPCRPASIRDVRLVRPTVPSPAQSPAECRVVHGPPR